MAGGGQNRIWQQRKPYSSTGKIDQMALSVFDSKLTAQ